MKVITRQSDALQEVISQRDALAEELASTKNEGDLEKQKLEEELDRKDDIIKTFVNQEFKTSQSSTGSNQEFKTAQSNTGSDECAAACACDECAATALNSSIYDHWFNNSDESNSTEEAIEG